MPQAEVDKFTLKTECYMGVSPFGISGPVFIDSSKHNQSRQYYVSDVFAGEITNRTRKTNDPTTTKMVSNPKSFVFPTRLSVPAYLQKGTGMVGEERTEVYKQTHRPHQRL